MRRSEGCAGREVPRPQVRVEVRLRQQRATRSRPLRVPKLERAMAREAAQGAADVGAVVIGVGGDGREDDQLKAAR